ncbi:hypothetical protein FB451DRAFT_1565606 [Mycena latifolia]|nr:hypothetical protein FB451DRAFT_1565606 [Mycena latifolia]
MSWSLSSFWRPRAPPGVCSGPCLGALYDSGLGSCNGRDGHEQSIRFVNKCGSGTASLFQPVNGRVLSGASANFTGPLLGGIGFLDQGFCGSAPNLNCTSVEINLGSKGLSLRILATPFSVPVSFVFSEGCSSPRQCLNPTCPRHLLECRARDASAVVTFCPTPPSLSPPPSTVPQISSTTSRISAAPAVPPAPTWTSSPPTRPVSHLAARASNMGRLLGAELGGAIGGAAFLLVLFIAVLCLRRRRARDVEARMPQRQTPVPFVVNPTWVLASPTSATDSHLSLPDRARPRTVPVVAHQTSLPNLAPQTQISLPNLRSATQYRARMLRPRASTVGAGSVLTRTETGGSRDRSHSDSAAGVGLARSGSESAVWRPRIDILGSRQQQHRERAEQSFWAE